MVNDMWTFLCPVLRTAFSNVNVESINDWGTAIATASENRDPNRNHWLMELILEDPIRVEQVTPVPTAYHQISSLMIHYHASLAVSEQFSNGKSKINS